MALDSVLHVLSRDSLGNDGRFLGDILEYM